MTQELAINGGEPIRDKLLPYGHQWIDDEDIKAVSEILHSDWITQGPKVAEFEKVFAKYVEAKYAVAVNSGTAALKLFFRQKFLCGCSITRLFL